MNKMRFQRFMEYNWYFIFIFAFVSFAAFYYPINKIDEYKDFEKISLFSACGYLKDEEAPKDIEDNFDKVLECNFYCYSPFDNSITSLYEAFGKNADYVVLSENDLKQMEEFIQTTFYNVNLVDSSYSGLFDCFYYNDSPYGLKIYDKDDESYNEKFHFIDLFLIEGQQNYYFLFNQASTNYYPLNEDNKSNNAIEVSSYLLRRYINEGA